MNPSQYNSLPDDKKRDINIIKEILRNHETVSIKNYDFPKDIFNDINILLLFIGICIKNYNNMKKYHFKSTIDFYSLEEINAKITDETIFTAHENVNKMIAFIKSFKPYNNEICFDIIFLILSEDIILEFNVISSFYYEYDGLDETYLKKIIESKNSLKLYKAYIKSQDSIIKSLIDIIEEDQYKLNQ